MNPSISIVIPSYNHLTDCLIPCCESIIKHTDLENIEVIIVANGCTDNTKEYVEKLGIPFKLIWIEEQIGYTKATNIGIKNSAGEYIILLNNDVVILDQPKNQWIEMLLAPFLSDNKMGITGAMKNHCPYANRDFLIFFCVMISKKMFEEVGILDEGFAPAYGEDTDFACRIQDAGYKIKQVPYDSDVYYADKRMVGGIMIYHEGNVSYKNWKDGNKLLEKNNKILHDRYNKTPKEIERALTCDGFMSDKELLHLAFSAKQHSVILELGSWHGRSSRAIADNLPDGGVLYCVDTWKGSAVEQETNHVSAKMMDGDHAYYEFLQNNIDLIQVGKIIPLRMSGDNAARFFKEKNITLDLCFIDAGHTFEEVKSDIMNWLPLVKINGIICGHDYYTDNGIWQGVRDAVDSIFPNVEKIKDTSIWSHIVTKEDFKSNVYDCFPFNNELDILEIRFKELWDAVDRFIIVEADRTHGNKPKPYYFKDNLNRFEKYLSKVSHVMISDYPATDSWSIERHQRDCIMRALTNCKNNDTIIISDLDEIPNAEVIKNYSVDDGIKSFEMDLYYYHMNCRAKDKWYESKILSYELLKQLTPCGARYIQAPSIPNGGKHLSYFGGLDSIIKKIEDTAHQEYNKNEFKDSTRIEEAIKEGKDLFGRMLEFEKV